MFDANEVINGLYGYVYDENGKQMQETKAFEANVDYADILRFQCRLFR